MFAKVSIAIIIAALAGTVQETVAAFYSFDDDNNYYSYYNYGASSAFSGIIIAYTVVPVSACMHIATDPFATQPCAVERYGGVLFAVRGALGCASK